MTQPRRLGAEGSAMRVRFVEAAEALLHEEGGGAISARRVAERAGQKAQLLYYYFRTMDDLLRAVIQRVNERRRERFEAVLAAPHPLRALWDLNSDPAAAILAIELNALANRREAIRAEIVESAREFRHRQNELVGRLLPSPVPGEIRYSAQGVVMIAAALSRMLVNETALGLFDGHAEAIAIVEQLLARVEADPAGPGGPPC